MRLSLVTLAYPRLLIGNSPFVPLGKSWVEVLNCQSLDSKRVTERHTGIPGLDGVIWTSRNALNINGWQVYFCPH